MICQLILVVRFCQTTFSSSSILSFKFEFEKPQKMIKKVAQSFVVVVVVVTIQMDNKIWGIILFTNLNLFHQLKAKRRSSICGSVVRAIASKHSSSNPANGKILKLLSYAKKICTRCFDLNRRYFVLCLLQKLVNECLTVRDLDSYECSGRLTNKLNTYKEIQILKQIS